MWNKTKKLVDAKIINETMALLDKTLFGIIQIHPLKDYNFQKHFQEFLQKLNFPIQISVRTINNYPKHHIEKLTYEMIQKVKGNKFLESDLDDFGKWLQNILRIYAHKKRIFYLIIPVYLNNKKNFRKVEKILEKRINFCLNNLKKFNFEDEQIIETKKEYETKKINSFKKFVARLTLKTNQKKRIEAYAKKIKIKQKQKIKLEFELLKKEKLEELFKSYDGDYIFMQNKFLSLSQIYTLYKQQKNTISPQE